MTGQYDIGPIDVVSIFSVRMTNHSFFTMYHRPRVPTICALYSKPYYLESTTFEVIGTYAVDGRELIFNRLFNTCEFTLFLSFISLFYNITYFMFFVAPIPWPKSGSDFTEEVKKVIAFAALHPRTKHQFLQPHLDGNVKHLFSDNLKSSTPCSNMNDVMYGIVV